MYLTAYRIPPLICSKETTNSIIQNLTDLPPNTCCFSLVICLRQMCHYSSESEIWQSSYSPLFSSPYKYILISKPLFSSPTAISFRPSLCFKQQISLSSIMTFPLQFIPHTADKIKTSKRQI